MASLLELTQQREKAMSGAEEILKRAELGKRALTADESKVIDTNMAEVAHLTPQIRAIESKNTILTMFRDNPGALLDAGRQGDFGSLPGSANRPNRFADVEAFVRTGRIADSLRPGMTASLAEGSDLGVAIPPYQLESFRIDSPYIAPFEAAGATIYTSENFGMTKIKQPFVLPGSAVTTFAEETGPTTTSDASVVGITLTPAKYAMLTKISEEADADIVNLGGAVTEEGTRRVYKSTSDAATTAMLSSLIAAGAWITRGSDNLTSLLDLEAAINPVFASANNALMLSRTSLAELRNTRTSTNAPIFDPITRTFLGYKTVINDALGSHIVFGNFAEGAFLSYSALFVQRLLEAYKEQGKIGIRFARRMASAFFSDASNGSIQPLFSLNLDTAGS